MNFSPVLLTFALLSLNLLAAPYDEAAVLQELPKSNVEWAELGQSFRDSMPPGNGDLAANVWFEENGDVRFYLFKCDSWSEPLRTPEEQAKNDAALRSDLHSDEIIPEPKDSITWYWPAEWSVHFRLHALRQTVVTAAASDGKITASQITPAARAADLEFPAGPHLDLL